MRAANTAQQRPDDAKLLVVDRNGSIHSGLRTDLLDHLRPGDVLVANDAATIPASLSGVHQASGKPIEVRLAARPSLETSDLCEFTAIVFGEGDHRTRTEDRKPPPRLNAGDTLLLGSLKVTVKRLLGHPRFIVICFSGSPDEVWAGIANHGRPIQYAHIEEPLAVWDVWTQVAALPVAFEPPSAGFVLDWELLRGLEERDVRFATLTHAAGISSTGDEELDAMLPLNEPYNLPLTTVQTILRAKARGSRVIALGTSVTRAIEHAAAQGDVRGGEILRPGKGLATQRISASTDLRYVDAIVSGAHEPTESHYDLLRAFVDDVTLRRMTTALEDNNYRTHEFGDSVLIERSRGFSLAQ